MRVVIAGAGVAGLEAMMALEAHAGGLLDVEVLAPERLFTYRPAAALSPFDGLAPERFPVADLAVAHGASVVRDALESVDLDRLVVRTQGGEERPFDELLIATGARLEAAVPGAVTFRGGQDVAAVRRAVEDLAARRASSVGFVVPAGVPWSLAAYELALNAALGGAPGIVHLVTAEERPLGAFGATPSEELRRRLVAAGVRLHPARPAASFEGGWLRIGPGEAVRCDAAFALARPAGPRIAGLPCDADGFLPVDAWGAVPGAPVHAAGDAAALALKQGGVAAQLADVVARGIARRAGAQVTSEPLRPVLRGLLLVGASRLFLRRDLAEDDGEVSELPLWHPAAKVAAHHLAPYLAGHLDLAVAG